MPIVFTRTQTINFTKGYTGAAVLHKQVGADLLVVDIGVDADMSMIAGIYHKSMRRGTDNAAHGPAMSYEEAARAMLVGVEMVQEARALGYQVVGTGEMSAGNTTTAAAIIAAICGCLPVQTVGRGAGLSEAAYLHKVEIVAQMLAVNQPDPHDALDVLAKVGGFDIAGLAGVFLGAAYYRMPVVLDGLISIAAALVACRLQPKVREFIIPSHAGYELGFGVAARALGITPFFNLDMRFGEATGCPMTFNLIDLAGAVMRNMATLAEAGTPDEYVRQVASFEF